MTTMNDPVDKVFDTTYSIYLQSLSVANSTIGVLANTAEYLESNVTSVLNKQLGLHPTPVAPVHKSCWISCGVLSKRNLLFFLLTGSSVVSTYLLTNRGTKRRRKLRRANKLYNGARYETILIVGSPLNPSVQRLINDLNQRNFIIYITVSSEQELKIVEQEDSIDIRPLAISYESVKTVKEAMNNFQTILSTPVLPFPNADEHYLNLKSVLIIPDYNHFPKGLIEEIPLKEWERVLNGQFFKTASLLYNGLLQVIRDNNLQKRNIERINRVYSDDDSDLEEGELENMNANIGGDTKLIFIDFINDTNKRMKNFHFPEQISVTLKRRLFEAIYQDVKYSSQFDIPRHPSLLKRLFYPRLKSPHYINMSQLVINYSPSSSSTRSTDSVYLSSVVESQYKLNTSSKSSRWLTKIWNTLTSLIGGNRNQKLSSTRLHHKIFDMIYDTRDLPKHQYLSSNGIIYDYFKQLAD